ncbi:MAG: hypothetical protein WCF03_19945 [Nitrososphaeraceae archaeon]
MRTYDKDNKNYTSNTAINWNDIIKHDVRSIDDADLGKVQGLYEPFVVTEKGTINKEKFYIPKYLFEKYDGEVLYFNITEQEAKDTCMRNTAPSEDETKQIVQTVTRRSVAVAPSKAESKSEEKRIVAVKGKNRNQQLKKIPATSSPSRLQVDEQEIVKKIKTAANDLKDIISSGTKVAKQKIKERKEIAAEKQADKDAEKISKMGDLAMQFTSSFEDIMSEIRTRTYAEQEQIYLGFLKLMEQQRGLLIARRDLAAKLKGSVQTKPALVATSKRPSLRGKEQLRVSKEPELPPPSSLEQRQLPELVTHPPNTKTEEEVKKTKPQIVTPSKKESPEQITDRKPLRSSSSTTEPTVIEIPSAKIPTKKQKIITTATDKEDSIMTKNRKGNRNVDTKST